MEPDMVVDMLNNIEGHVVNVKGIIGDEDTTTIARARKEVNAALQKDSDMNHLKKTLGNHLYDIRSAKKHKTLTPKVIKYLQKMYCYAIKQNQGDPEKLAKSLYLQKPCILLTNTAVCLMVSI